MTTSSTSTKCRLVPTNELCTGKRRAVMRAMILLATVLSAAADAQPGPSSERNVRTALARIAAIDPQLHSVLAIDPTAIDQARAHDSAGRSVGLVAGQPVLIKDNIETAGPL